ESMPRPDLHDRLAVGGAATCGGYPDARNPLAFPELLRDHGLEAWTVREIWYAGGPAPDHVVDVTDTFDRKLAALRAHASQTAHMDDLDGMLRGRFAALAPRAGLGGGRLAEAFAIIRTA